jgi:hypothetical protein
MTDAARRRMYAFKDMVCSLSYRQDVVSGDLRHFLLAGELSQTCIPS